ncbi:hypothetical protein [Mycolicibacterium holsaticum]|nr:hypothetical protein [Mycolicibacterium holsaticum]
MEIVADTGGFLNMSPLCGGIPPDIAWPYLKRAANLTTTTRSH